MPQVFGRSTLHAGLRSHAFWRIQFQETRQADLIRRVLRAAWQTIKSVHISFAFIVVVFCSLVLSRFAYDFCFTLLAFLRRFVHVHRAGTPVKLLRLWFVTCCSSIRPSGPTSRTFAPIGMILLSFLFCFVFFLNKQHQLFHHYNGDILYCDRWVNEGYGESCLEVAEELANQTPVRLDLLLSLVPPPESTETVVVSAKNDQTASTVSRNPFALRMRERWNKSVQQPNG